MPSGGANSDHQKEPSQVDETNIRSNAAYRSPADCLLVPDVALSGHRDGGVEGISGSFELNPATYSFWWQHLHDVRTAIQVQSRAERTVGEDINDNRSPEM